MPMTGFTFATIGSLLSLICGACSAPAPIETGEPLANERFRVLADTYTVGRRFLADPSARRQPLPLDGWGTRMLLEEGRNGPYLLRSAGSDRNMHTPDDVVVRAERRLEPAGPSGYARPERARRARPDQIP
jgi:hypothetical protein